MKVTFVINFETLEGILDGDPNECYQANEMFVMLSVFTNQILQAFGYSEKTQILHIKFFIYINTFT